MFKRALNFFFSRVVRNLSAAKLGDPVCLRGKVIPRDLVECTLTGARGVYFHYQILQSSPSMNAPLGAAISIDDIWTVLKEDAGIAEFYLEVDGELLIVSPEKVVVEECEEFHDEQIPFHIYGQKALRLLVEEGDVIEVEGRLTEVNDLYADNRGYRASLKRLMIEPMDNLRIKLVSRNPFHVPPVVSLIPTEFGDSNG